MTVLETLQRVLNPQYVGWKDQYKAICWVLNIDPDSSYDELMEKIA